METHMREIARSVALALQDPALRQLVLHELRASPFRERKLHLRTLLTGRGTAVLDRMAVASSRTVQSLLGSLDSIVDLEFYMPVPDHQRRWNGGPELLVATVLHDDGTVPTAFTLSGEAVRLRSAKTPPTTPTLAIVPVETDFSRPQISAQAAGMASSTPGIYMTYAYIPDNHEGFLMGMPEFEVHLFRQDASGAYIDVVCSGAEQNSPFNYDHNAAEWSGEVLLVSEATIGEAAFEIHVWEDDTDACKPQSGRPPNTTSATIQQLGSFAAKSWAVYLAPNTITRITAILVAVPAAFDLVNSLHKDDLVGLVEGLDTHCWPSQTGPVTYPIRHPDGQARGQATLDFRFGDEREPECASPPPPPPDWSAYISGPKAIHPNSTCGWGASTGGSGSPTWPLTYHWYRNDNLVDTASTYYGAMEGASSFTLSVWITDASGTGKNNTIFVVADEEVWEECLM